MFERVRRGENDPLAWGAYASKGAELPARLESHSTLKWEFNFVRVNELVELRASTGELEPFRVAVTLGSGKQVKSKPEKHEWLHDRMPVESGEPGREKW